MPVLVIAEHNNNALNPNVYNTVTAARQIDPDVHVLLAGHQCQGALGQASAIHGIKSVLHADDAAYAHPLAENFAALIVKLADGYSHIIAPASFFGKNIMPRVAALLDVQQISDITGIESSDTFVRPIYAGNAFAAVKSNDKKVVLTVRPTAFDPAKSEGGNAPVENIDSAGDTGLTTFTGQELTKSERPDLATAKIIISGGRGMGSNENFHKLLEPVADKLGAAIGASRAAVDAGYCPNDMQVGQTGKIVAPQLYIAVGISGAIQHLAGMKESKVIVAINKDEEAPIFQVADYGLVADLFDVLPELTEAL
ncbi:MAG: electron transfer flavoprotein subunit alpha/FixB family protein [Rhodospirillales bacterium]|nr:electron transfer flavoprotein subunit alpha/FixB family protein [Rhodospirillales bacterium]